VHEVGILKKSICIHVFSNAQSQRDTTKTTTLCFVTRE